LQATRNRHIGVIGTRATIRSGAYEKTLRAADNNVRVSSRACPLLVPLIEEGLLDDDVTDRMITRYLEPLLADGSTHWCLVVRIIRCSPTRSRECSNASHAGRFRAKLCTRCGRNFGSTITSDDAAKPR
jgi:glutamate racemase